MLLCMLLMTPACQRNGVVSTTQARVMGSSQAHHVFHLNILHGLWGAKGGGGGGESFPYLITEVLVKYLHACMRVKIDRRIFFFFS